jgi:hypothetical protein
MTRRGRRRRWSHEGGRRRRSRGRGGEDGRGGGGAKALSLSLSPPPLLPSLPPSPSSSHSEPAPQSPLSPLRDSAQSQCGDVWMISGLCSYDEGLFSGLVGCSTVATAASASASVDLLLLTGRAPSPRSSRPCTARPRVCASSFRALLHLLLPPPPLLLLRSLFSSSHVGRPLLALVDVDLAPVDGVSLSLSPLSHPFVCP